MDVKINEVCDVGHLKTPICDGCNKSLATMEITNRYTDSILLCKKCLYLVFYNYSQAEAKKKRKK